jgi:hypothetical protein
MNVSQFVHKSFIMKGIQKSSEEANSVQVYHEPKAPHKASPTLILNYISCDAPTFHTKGPADLIIMVHALCLMKMKNHN